MNLSEHERGPLSYIAGYILAKLQKQCSSKPDDELQTLLENMNCPGIENTYIDARSRGGSRHFIFSSIVWSSSSDLLEHCFCILLVCTQQCRTRVHVRVHLDPKACYLNLKAFVDQT